MPEGDSADKSRYLLYGREKEGEELTTGSKNATDVRLGSAATGTTSSVDPMVMDDDIFDNKSVNDKKEEPTDWSVGKP